MSTATQELITLMHRIGEAVRERDPEGTEKSYLRPIYTLLSDASALLQERPADWDVARRKASAAGRMLVENMELEASPIGEQFLNAMQLIYKACKVTE